LVEIVIDVKKFDSVITVFTKANKVKGDGNNKTEEASLDLEA
jgi:hypothetical protein